MKEKILKQETGNSNNIKKLFVTGDSDLLYHLAMMYITGNGVKQNLDIGCKYLLEAEAQGVYKAKETIIKILTIGVQKGYAHALYELGFRYLSGDGVKYDIDLGTKLIVKSAMKGFPKAHEAIQYMLSYCTREAFKEPVFSEFSKSCLIAEPEAKTPTKIIIQAYRKYCRDNNISPLSDEKVHEYLQKELGLKNSRFQVNGIQSRGYIGIRLKEASDIAH